ncbi:hypothetical protein C5167_039493 [Papaver somniferum]|uniref:Uncharacterized protein n=1 Tax=Papaver somniferum TaxID=3469 RepID=A0A4Y7IGF5_PAPSO|nr:hypothetical protein C5167_039493 [Papaver somniferum]
MFQELSHPSRDASNERKSSHPMAAVLVDYEGSNSIKPVPQVMVQDTNLFFKLFVLMEDMVLSYIMQWLKMTLGCLGC